MKTTLRLSVLFLLLLSTGATLAQAQPAAPDSVRPALRAYHNVLRYDGLVFLAGGFAGYFDKRSAFPILLGYEWQVGRHSSISVEALFSTNNATDRIWGLGLQARYYIPQDRYPASLTGFYVAPMLGSRQVKLRDGAFPSCYSPSGYTLKGRSRALGGAGLLAGRQTLIGKKKHLLVDMSVGLMSWHPWNKSAAPYGCPGRSNDFRRYERHTLVPDGRFSLGYRF